MPDPSVRATLSHLLLLEVPADWERWSAHDIASRAFPRRRALLLTAGMVLLFGVLAVITDAATGSVPPPATIGVLVGVAAGPLLAAEARPELMRRSPGMAPMALGSVAGLAVLATLGGMVAVTEVTDVDCLQPTPEEVAAVAQHLRPDATIGDAAVVEDGQLRYLAARVAIGLEERTGTWLVRVGQGQSPAGALVGVVGPDAAQLSVGLRPAPATDVAAEAADCL